MRKVVSQLTLASALLLLCSAPFQVAEARDIEYSGGEVDVYVTPGEPTQITFPGEIGTGFRRTPSALSLDRKAEDLVIFSNQALNTEGEAIIVRLRDGRSYSVRIRRSSEENQRDPQVKLQDSRASILSDQEEELPPHVERNFRRPPASSVPGFMRELVLATEFGKASIPGYRISERYKGEEVMNDGTMVAKIDKIFIGPNLWGYVLDAENMLDSSQKINPASFRLDGTRSVSMKNWELAPQPLTAEQELAKRHTTKVYVITKARKSR